MRLSDLARRTKQIIDRRGGTESVKGDAREVRNISRGPGSLTDKAKQAAEALKEPGAAQAPGEPQRSREPDRSREPAGTPPEGGEPPQPSQPLRRPEGGSGS